MFSYYSTCSKCPAFSFMQAAIPRQHHQRYSGTVRSMYQSSTASDRSHLELTSDIINTILHNAWYLIVYGLRSGLFGGCKSGAVNFGASRWRNSTDAHDALVHCLAQMCKLHQQWRSGWQHLLHQYEIAIITAITLSVRIDKSEARASWQIGHQFLCILHPRVTFALSDLSSYIQCFPR